MLGNLNCVFTTLLAMTALYSYLIIRTLPNKAIITIFGKFDLVRSSNFIEISKQISIGELSECLQQYFHKMTENVFLFVPNLIGYSRIILAFVSFYYMADSPIIFAICYLVSGLLDAFDGHFARLLGQSSKFGAMLDMLTDRCATACLMVMLSEFFPMYRVVFQFLISLDIGSHWLHMYSSLIKGDQSHKTSANFFLRLYYTSRPVLFIMCAGNELFLVALYFIHFSYGPTVFQINNESVGLWSLLAYINFPIFFLKQLISMLHLVTASQDVVAYDVAERRKTNS